ncbi:hypothetical protein ACQW5G_04605 [Fructilactobacillus sp. Tb1]|uniref:hypothetical protein n=1 Tax=Fructilactobacillus sp. Tb1 TaxID=3422304 RepID=UPI003D27D89F
MDKEKQTQQVGNLIDSWLDAIDAQPQVAKLNESKITAIDAIIDSFAEIAIVGLDREPEQWTDGLLEEVMFARFMLLLEENEKTEEMYHTIPFALHQLFNYLQAQGVINNGKELNQWVDDNATKLQSLYNPKFDKFYRGLYEAMNQSGIDTSDKKTVDEFTKSYLNLHPELGIDLYKQDDQK